MMQQVKITEWPSPWGHPNGISGTAEIPQASDAFGRATAAYRALRCGYFSFFAGVLAHHRHNYAEPQLIARIPPGGRLEIEAG
jgi:hypothetical protein